MRIGEPLRLWASNQGVADSLAEAYGVPCEHCDPAKCRLPG